MGFVTYFCGPVIFFPNPNPKGSRRRLSTFFFDGHAVTTDFSHDIWNGQINVFVINLIHSDAHYDVLNALLDLRGCVYCINRCEYFSPSTHLRFTSVGFWIRLPGKQVGFPCFVWFVLARPTVSNLLCCVSWLISSVETRSIFILSQLIKIILR